jgi:phosphomannomutase
MASSGVRFGTSGARGLVADMSDEVCYAYTAAFLQAVSATHSRERGFGDGFAPEQPADRCGLCGSDPGTRACASTGAAQSRRLRSPFYAQTQQIPAVMITGSHIPFDRNGIKFYSASGEITKADEAPSPMPWLRSRSMDYSPSCRRPTVDAHRMYMARYLDFFPSRALAGMRLGFYEHSSVARDLLSELLRALGAEVVSLGRVDEFVPIDTEAVSEADVAQARRWAEGSTVSMRSYLPTATPTGRSWAMRHGDWFRGDVAGILCAQYLGAQAVATTVSCNTAVESCGAFSRVVRTRIGSPYVIEGIEQLIGLPELKTSSASSRTAAFSSDRLSSENGRTLAGADDARRSAADSLPAVDGARGWHSRVSDLRKSACRRALRPAIACRSSRPKRAAPLLQKLSASPAAIETLLDGLCGKPLGLDQTDGLRITLEGDEIVHFRPSGNAPELRCYAEAATQQRAGAAGACVPAATQVGAMSDSRQPLHLRPRTGTRGRPMLTCSPWRSFHADSTRRSFRWLGYAPVAVVA